MRAIFNHHFAFAPCKLHILKIQEMKLLLLCSFLIACGNCQFGGFAPQLPSSPLGHVASGATNAAKSTLESFTKQFGDFKNLYHKSYLNKAEEALRQNIFAKNAEKIANLAKGALPFKLKLNEYADLLSDEFNKAFNGFRQSAKPAEKPVPKGDQFAEHVDKIPENVDWRERGAVTPVKSQKLCAGCWAFSAAGALEGQYFKKTGKLIEISPQNLIDCAGPYGNDGCDGGLMNPAFEYIKDNKGVNLLDAYPFEAKNGKCRYKAADNSDVTNSGYVEIPSGNEKALEEAIATVGPISAAIDASLDTFQFYSDGVYYDAKCKNKPEDLNHAVLIVGYGKEKDGTEYWLVKNSYGNTWGQEGYIKMAKNRDNHCGIATYASYPKL